ncbi:MAG: hypothetical protein R2739_08250 [Chitinophagales bacterium]
MKFFDKSYLKALPLLVILTGMLLYKFRYTLHLSKPTLKKQEVIDSSYLYREDIKPIIASGYMMGVRFNGMDASLYPTKSGTGNSMDMINNDQYFVIDLYDEKKVMEVYIAIRDLTLMTKIPFSVSFETGEKILVTAFVRNASGVNIMYGGTIYNNKGKLKITGYNKSRGMVSGELDADLTGVIENGVCEIRSLRFSNAVLLHDKVK